MLPVSALFEKGVKFLKTDCFVSASRIAWRKSPKVSGFFKRHILMACNGLPLVLVCCSNELRFPFKLLIS